MFDTAEIVVRDDIQSENNSGNRSSIILRCSGRVELYKIDPGDIHRYIDITVDDYLMPGTLEPFTHLIVTSVWDMIYRYGNNAIPSHGGARNP